MIYPATMSSNYTLNQINTRFEEASKNLREINKLVNNTHEVINEIRRRLKHYDTSQTDGQNTSQTNSQNTSQTNGQNTTSAKNVEQITRQTPDNRSFRVIDRSKITEYFPELKLYDLTGYELQQRGYQFIFIDGDGQIFEPFSSGQFSKSVACTDNVSQMYLSPPGYIPKHENDPKLIRLELR